MCSDAPDADPLIGQAAKANADLSREMVAYFRQKDIEQAPRQARMDNITEALANQQMSTSKFNDDRARETWDRYKETGIPLENAVNAEAMDYDNEANLAKAAGEAGNDVAASMAQAEAAQSRNMARMGVNPADGRAQAANSELATTGALARAAAMNGARTQRSTMGTMLRKDAAGMARGMPGTAAQTFGVAGAAGGQASGAAGAAIGTANSIAASMGAGFNGAGGLNNSAASILNQSRSLDLQAASQKTGLGDILGAAGSLGAGLGALGFNPFGK